MQESNKSFDSTQFEVNGSRFKQGYYDTSIKSSMTIWSSHFETEILVLDNNHTWNVVLCPPSVKPIGSKWVFSIKLCFEGFIDCYKAQLVVLGNKQKYGLDYNETFAQVARMTTIHTIKAFAASQF